MATKPVPLHLPSRSPATGHPGLLHRTPRPLEGLHHQTGRGPSENQQKVKDWGWVEGANGMWSHPRNWVHSILAVGQHFLQPRWRRLGRVRRQGTPGGAWFDLSSGQAYVGNPPGFDSDPSAIKPGEFTAPWSGEFTGPDAPDPFSYAPGEHGYQPLNEEFGWNPKGDMPRPDPGFIPELNSWGWHEQPDGTWRHRDGDTAYFVNKDHDGQYHWRQDVSRGPISGGEGRPYRRWNQRAA